MGRWREVVDQGIKLDVIDAGRMRMAGQRIDISQNRR